MHLDSFAPIHVLLYNKDISTTQLKDISTTQLTLEVVYRVHKLAVESTRGIGIDAIWVSRLTLKRVWSLDTTRAGVPLWLRSGHQHSQSLAAFCWDVR